MAEKCKIVSAGLGIDAGVVGSMALALIEDKLNFIIPFVDVILINLFAKGILFYMHIAH